MEPFFSIVIPVFNQAGKMDRCVDSLRRQSFGNFEVLLVDDGSGDASLSMLEDFSASDSRFRVIRHEVNRSVLAARYSGMAAAEGSYILFLDSDDYFGDESLNDLYSSLKEDPVDILMFGAVLEPAGEILKPVGKGDLLRGCLDSSVTPCVWKNCYSRKLIRKALSRFEPFYCNMSEDVFLSCVFYSCMDSFSTTEKTVYHYSVGVGMSATRVSVPPEKLRKDLENVGAAASHLVSYISEYEPDYLDLANDASNNMVRYVLFQPVYFEEDWCRVFEYLEIFHCEKYRDAFEFGCNVVLPAKIKRSLGLAVNHESLE